MSHPLATRLLDLKIELYLWLAAWFFLSIALAVAAYLYFVPPDGAGMWQHYMVARSLEFVGLAKASIPGVLLQPEFVLAFCARNLEPETLAVWDRDLLTIAASPALAAALIPFIYLVFQNKD